MDGSADPAMLATDATISAHASAATRTGGSGAQALGMS